MALIARQIKFRPKSVLALPVEKKARHLASLAQVSDLLAARLLVAYHLEHQRPMMGAFLDALGIPHEDGLIKDESPTAPDAATLDTGRGDALGRVSERRRRRYFWTLLWQDPETWGGLQGRPELAACLAAFGSSRARGALRPTPLHLHQSAAGRSSARLLQPRRQRRAAEGVQEGAGGAWPDRRIRANKSGCLDQCEHGPNVVVYPDGVWYGGVTEADVDEIVDRHLVGGEPVARLRLADSCVNTATCPHRPRS